MAASKNERPPRDLSVPETMKIAALLAELMPPGNLTSKSGEIPLHPPVESGEDLAEPHLAAPMLEIEELDDVEPIADTIPASLRPSAQGRTKVEPSGLAKSNFPVEFPTPPPMPRGRFDDIEVTQPIEPPPLPSAIKIPSEFLGNLNWNSDPETAPIPEPPANERAAATVDSPAPGPLSPTPAADPELIPLGDLSTMGFFSLVNWLNDPSKVRQPRRADFGLDEQTLALARRNPFYTIGQPRRPESRTVAEVLAEFVWE